jgi:hypothetical protein
MKARFLYFSILVKSLFEGLKLNLIRNLTLPDIGASEAFKLVQASKT